MSEDETSKKFVTYRGQKMMVGWPEKIEEAQTISFYDIDGRNYKRIRYGDELHGTRAQTQPCRDCCVLKGELHVPRCDYEQCPKCGEQVIGCECRHKIVELH